MKNDDWSWFDGSNSGDKENTTIINDNRSDRDAIRQNENTHYKDAAERYERQAREAREAWQREYDRDLEEMRKAKEAREAREARRRYAQEHQARYSDPHERRLNTGGSSRGGSLYGNDAEPVYNGYERSGGTYDNHARMNSRASNARYSDIGAQEEELRRLREESQSEKSGRRKGKNDYKGPSPREQKKQAKRQRKQMKKRGKGKKIRKILLALLIIFTVFCVWFLMLTSHFDKVDTSNKDLGINPGVDDQLSGYRNIAVLGSDARSNESLDGSRTDAIIILSIKKSNGDINMISIMRDSYLKLENQNHELILDKITHAHHWAGGVGTISALNRSLDLNIKEYIIFNWQAVADTVDTLGGITVDIKKNEIRDLNKWGPETGRNVGRKYHKIKKTGEQDIDGVQATTYCRIRKTSGGDPGRGRRYKKVMAAVMKKAITHPWKMNDLSNNVFPNIRTNMSGPGMLWAALRAPGYDIKKSYGWPKKYYGGLLGNGLWYAVPRTLKSNVKWLHKKAFDQKNYSLSDNCSDISDEIIYQTGVQ